MSRSYKKHPVAKLKNNKSMKKIYSRRIRHCKDEDAYQNYKKKNNSWEICDYKCYANSSDLEEMHDDWNAKKHYTRK